jgi:hypothetical protein
MIRRSCIFIIWIIFINFNFNLLSSLQGFTCMLGHCWIQTLWHGQRFLPCPGRRQNDNTMVTIRQCDGDSTMVTVRPYDGDSTMMTVRRTVTIVQLFRHRTVVLSPSYCRTVYCSVSIFNYCNPTISYKIDMSCLAHHLDILFRAEMNQWLDYICIIPITCVHLYTIFRKKQLLVKLIKSPYFRFLQQTGHLFDIDFYTLNTRVTVVTKNDLEARDKTL